MGITPENAAPNVYRLIGATPRMETRTQYAIKGTTIKHGKRQLTIETNPLHEEDHDWNALAVINRREWQASVGITPDAELLSRTITITEWAPELITFSYRIWNDRPMFESRYPDEMTPERLIERLADAVDGVKNGTGDPAISWNIMSALYGAYIEHKFPTGPDAPRLMDELRALCQPPAPAARPLKAYLSVSGTFRVHAADCHDLTKLADSQHDTPFDVAATTREAIAAELHQDFIAEGGMTADQALDHVLFLPCTGL